jgi:hypothetical protein
VVQSVDGGLDDSDFLVAERSVFSGVGIESGDGDTRLVDSAAL